MGIAAVIYLRQNKYVRRVDLLISTMPFALEFCWNEPRFHHTFVYV